MQTAKPQNLILHQLSSYTVVQCNLNPFVHRLIADIPDKWNVYIFYDT